MSKAAFIDSIFNGKTYEDDQGYDIHDFANGQQPVSVDQDWDNEATIYTFDDGSKLIVSGPSYEVVAPK